MSEVPLYWGDTNVSTGARKVNVRLPGKGNSNSHGGRPVHLIITMIKWIRTSRMSIKNSLSSTGADDRHTPRPGRIFFFFITLQPRVE